VYSGELVIGYSGKKIDAEVLPELTNLSYDELVDFKHVQRPSDIPIEELKELFSLLGLKPGLVTTDKTLPAGVEQLQNSVETKIKQILEISHRLSGPLRFWNEEVLNEQEKQSKKQNLDLLKEFLENLQRYDTVAKIKNLKLIKEEISSKRELVEGLDNLEKILHSIDEVSKIADYLSKAELILPQNDSLQSMTKGKKAEIISKITSNPQINLEEISTPLNEIKKSFTDDYYDAHKKSRLDSESNDKLTKLLNSDTMKRLQSLRRITLLDSTSLIKLENDFGTLKSCTELDKNELGNEPLCPHCNYNPHEVGIFNSKEKIASLDKVLNQIEENMQKSLADNLTDPTVKGAVDLLEERKKKIVQKLAEKNQLPDEITDEFIQSLNEVLSGLEKAEIKIEELVEYLQKGGLPCTQEELQNRFNQYLEEKTKGKTKSKVRFVLE